MKKINIILLIFFSLSFLLSSCYKKETSWLDENADLSGEHYPQVSSFSKITEGDHFYIGDEVQFEMNFWSKDPIASTSLLANGEEYDKQDYSAAFSSQTNMDSIVYTYTVPELDVDKIVITGKVVNENGLERESGGIELKISACERDLPELFNSKGDLELTIYEIDDNGEVVDSTMVNYTVDTTISLTKTDEVSYFLEDITFGFAKQYFDGEDMVGTDIDRDICTFSYDKPIDIDPDVKAYFKCVGVIEGSGDIKFDWSLFVYSLDDVLLGFYKGTNTLTPAE